MAMHKVILALGSNRADRHQQLERAIRLCGEFVDMERLSTAIDTEPIGIDTEGNFANQMILATTSLQLDQLNDRLKAVERRLGRNAADSGMIAIDIDIMQYDSLRLHLADWNRQYIKTLIAQL
ncbi:MAG: 2-amino-4-hydroxy-6-hydroxymethyldihydropteridine diphosphokinase [Prevotella sp.]